MMRADVNTLLVDLPGTIKAFVAKDTDDFYSDLTADQIERVRHGKQ